MTDPLHKAKWLNFEVTIEGKRLRALYQHSRDQSEVRYFDTIEAFAAFFDGFAFSKRLSYEGVFWCDGDECGKRAHEIWLEQATEKLVKCCPKHRPENTQIGWEKIISKGT